LRRSNRPRPRVRSYSLNMGGGNSNLHPVIVKNGGTSGFGTVIAINPTKDAAIFIGMNQVGAQPAIKAVEILRHLP